MGTVALLPVGRSLEPPQRLLSEHDVADFDCGEPALDTWLKSRAKKNENARASRTYVVLRDGVVIGYYCLAAGSILRSEVRGSMARQMPDPMPIIVIGRLAVDRSYAGAGLGASLLQDAMRRAVEAANVIGAPLLIVHAKHEKAAGFYRRFEFEPSPINHLTLMVRIKDMAATLSADE